MTRQKVAALVLAALVVVAVLAPILAPVAPDALDLSNRRAAPSAAHWFGTDELGRDVLSRALFGARVSLAVGLLSAAVAGAIGVTIGAASGFFGGRIDAVLMRITDAVLSMPRLLLLMVAAAILSPSLALLVVLVGLVGWMETARVTRAAFLASREREFVLAARALGASSWRLVTRAPAAARRARDCGVHDARRRARHPARVNAELLRGRGAAARRQLGEYALPGAIDDDDRAVAGVLSGRVHLRHRGGD